MWPCGRVAEIIEPLYISIIKIYIINNITVSIPFTRKKCCNNKFPRKIEAEINFGLFTLVYDRGRRPKIIF